MLYIFQDLDVGLYPMLWEMNVFRQKVSISDLNSKEEASLTS